MDGKIHLIKYSSYNGSGSCINVIILVKNLGLVLSQQMHVHTFVDMH